MVNPARSRPRASSRARRRAGALGVRPGRAISLRGRSAGARRGRLPVGVGDEPREPQHREPAREPAPDRRRPARGARPVHASELAFASPRATWRRWARRSPTAASIRSTGERVVDEETCRHSLSVMTTAGHVRDLGRLAVRRRPPRQERDRRRHRHGLARQGRPRDVLAAARRGGQQRRGQLAARFLSRALGLDLFASEPAAQVR